MKVFVRLVGGYTINFEAPNDFSFVSFVSQVRAQGAWIDAGGIYVPHERIEMIAAGALYAPSMPEGTVRQ